MDDTPEQHRQLIAHLIDRGVHANFRRWAMGDTVFVGARPRDRGGIRGFERYAYLVPAGDGRWEIHLEFFDNTPVPKTAVVNQVVRFLLLDDGEYKQEMERRRNLPENAGRRRE